MSILRMAPVLILTAALAACGPSEPVEPISPADAVDAVTTPPVHALIGYRGELDLSSSQITEIDSIGQRLHRLNAPLERRLQELPRRTATRHRPQTRTRRDDPRPMARPTTGFSDPNAAREIMEDMAEHNREARLAVADVLTDEQRAKVCDIFSRPAPARGERRIVGQMPIWQWCQAEAEETSASA